MGLLEWKLVIRNFHKAITNLRDGLALGHITLPRRELFSAFSVEIIGTLQKPVFVLLETSRTHGTNPCREIEITFLNVGAIKELGHVAIEILSLDKIIIDREGCAVRL